MLRARESVRLLEDRDLDAAYAVLSRAPVVNCFVTSRLDAAGLDPRRLGAEVWGYVRDGSVVALCYAGPNLVPVGADVDACAAFAERARKHGRHCSSIVGPLEEVDQLWRRLEPVWGPAREVRRPQPLLAIGRPARVRADPTVRRVTLDEIDMLLPACIAMFTEEVGVSPVGGDGGALYRARVRELVSEGRSYARIDAGRVVFKAEVGATTRDACQVQGVWVDPALRGQGLGTSGTAAVVNLALKDCAPVVSLYVNDFNVPARAAYARVGFHEIGEFQTVLF